MKKEKILSNYETDLYYIHNRYVSAKQIENELRKTLKKSKSLKLLKEKIGVKNEKRS